jgi:hypothetical protein
VDLDRYCGDKDIEVCGVQLNTNRDIFCIIAVYRSPSGNFSTFLSSMELILHKLCKKNVRVIICGDFNVNFREDCPMKRQLEVLFATFNLRPTINFPTRIGCNTSTLIDNIFINVHQYVGFETIPLSNGLSDHEGQLLILNVSSKVIKEKHNYYYRGINNESLYDFQMKLSYESWELVFNTCDLNSSFNEFLNLFLRHFNSSFPLKRGFKQKSKSWITKGIIVSCKRKRDLYLETKRTNNPVLLKYYKDYCRILSKVVNQAKRITYEKRVRDSKNITKATWNIINTEICKKARKTKDNIKALCIQGKRTTNLNTIVDAFNNYFIKIADNIHSKRIEKDMNSTHLLSTNKSENYMSYMSKVFDSPFPRNETVKTTNTEIEKIIVSLKASTTHGYEGISNTILKASKNFISVPLSYLCNRVLFEGIYPDRLKYAEIIPVFKKGEKCDLSNYRPISILTSFSKIFEKVMYTRLIWHLNKYKILSNHQFGFRTNRGTDNAIFQLISEILKALNQKILISGIFCDLEKAFDCVSHKVLLDKLMYYGIKDKHLELYKSYLHNRYQRTQIRDGYGNVLMRSKWARIRNGVPQGSVLGPLLFIIYINDLPKILELHSIPILFADDTSVLVSHPNPGQLKNVLEKVYFILSDWFSKNLLSLNIVKTCCINFSANNKMAITRDVGNLLPQISSSYDLKFLGIIITRTMNWERHIDELLIRLSSACYMLRNMKRIMSINIMKIIYNSYFHSVMSYGLIFWGNSAYAEKVFRMQKRAIRLIVGCQSKQSCRNRFRELNILPLRGQYVYLLMMYVVQNRDKFVPNNEYHDLLTRRRMDLHVNQVNLAVYGRGVTHMAVKVFNALPKNLKEIASIPNQFKVKLKDFLNNNTFYTLDEFFNR